MGPIMMPPAYGGIADASELLVYALPTIGSMLLFYGIYQVIAETKSVDRKKMQERLRENRPEREQAALRIMRRGALGESKSFADTVIGKFKFTPKLQTLLDQADLEWSASQMLLNLGGAAIVISVGLLVLQMSPIVAVGCGAAVLALPLLWLNFRRARRMRKLEGQLPDVFDMIDRKSVV